MVARVFYSVKFWAHICGEVILLGMFIIPTLTIGPYTGRKVDDFFGFEYGLNCLFSLAGLLAGIYLW